MKIFYFEDENGTYYSPNKTRRFKKLSGEEAYNFLRTEVNRGIRHRFLKFEIELPVSDDEKTDPEQRSEPIIEKVFVEVRPEQVERLRKAERREQYVAQCEKDSGLETVSLYAPLTEQEDLPLEEMIAFPEMSVEDNVLHEIELEMLRRALKTLSDDELVIIHDLYLADETLTERALGGKLGLSQKAINLRKQSILKKLKKIMK